MMPYKYLNQKGIEIRKQHYKLTNWSDYNESLRRRGDIEVWLSEGVIANWTMKDRVYDGTGTPDLYTDLAIIACHEIRKVFRLPLRQTQGFINSLFRRMGQELRCPDYSDLSKRLMRLKIKCPRYRKTDRPDDDLAAIAVDSTGLKRFGRDEWHQERHKVSGMRSWRKLHIAVNGDHIIQGCELTDRFIKDDQVVDDLLEQIEEPIDHFSADGAYDQNPVYQSVAEHSPGAEIVIPPARNAVHHNKNHPQRRRNIIEEVFGYGGRMGWQRRRHYVNHHPNGAT